MKPSTIYSKSGKGVQEASGKTSLLKRADRAVLSAIDGRATLGEVAQKVGKSFDGEFEKLIAQLDKDGFVREVTAAAPSSSQSRPAVSTVKPGAKAPAAKAGGAEDLDFTTIMPAIKPAPRPLASAAAPSKAQVSDAALRAKEQESALYKARQEAEAKAQAERERVKHEAEAKARAEAEAKARLDAENRLREEAIGRAKAAAEAQVKAARAKVEAEVQAKLEAERKVREEVERKVREEAERGLREAEALRQRLEEERKRREEEERRRQQEEERRASEEAERKAREDAERKRREEEETKRRVEEEARRLREEIEAKAREAAERARREEEDRLLREKEEQVRRAREAEEARMLQARAMEEARTRVRQRERDRDQDENRGRGKSKDETKLVHPTLPAAAAPTAPDGGSLDALMADLDSFSQREEEERQGREVADRQAREQGKLKAQAEAERRAQDDAERQMREQLERAARDDEERQRRDEEERQRRDEEERRARDEAERRAGVEERRRLEAEERKRRAQEALLAKAAPPPDIEVSDKDLDMAEVRHDEAAVAREARKAQREREREARQRAKEAKERAKAGAREARQRAKEAKERAKAAAREASVKYPKMRRKVNWGRPVGITLLTLLAAGLVALHVIPLPMDEYERAASDALGRPVKIGTGRLSLYSGVRLNLENVSVAGVTTIASARAYPQLRALVEGRQVLGRLELAGVTVPQSAIGAVVGAKLRGEGFHGARIFAKDLRLTGPVPLPVLEAEAQIGPDGAVSLVLLSGPESLTALLSPTASGEVEFDVTAATLTVPFAPELTFSSFAMKGIANRQGMNIASWGGGLLDGAVSGAANLRWSGAWHLEGGLTARAINAAVFAPALLSEGKAEGQARFSMSGSDPAKLYDAAHLEGNFSLGKGVLGTIDLSRVLHTSGRQYGGRTQFTEMTGHATYDRGAVALRNVNISAGALSAGASADIAPSGAIAGRIVADIRTTVQPLRAILVIGGTVKEPQVRN